MNLPTKVPHEQFSIRDTLRQSYSSKTKDTGSLLYLLYFDLYSFFVGHWTDQWTIYDLSRDMTAFNRFSSP